MRKLVSVPSGLALSRTGPMIPCSRGGRIGCAKAFDPNPSFTIVVRGFHGSVQSWRPFHFCPLAVSVHPFSALSDTAFGYRAEGSVWEEGGSCFADPLRRWLRQLSWVVLQIRLMMLAMSALVKRVVSRIRRQVLAVSALPSRQGHPFLDTRRFAETSVEFTLVVS